jgi:hypothetical protein
MSKSPLKTAIAVANSMIGSSLLVLPVNYLEKGVLQNTVGAVIKIFICIDYYVYCYGKYCVCDWDISFR